MTLPSQRARRWRRIVPIVFITYSLAYFDRVNYGFGAAAGLADDLKLTPAAAALLSSLFFVGYFIFQIPGAIYAEQRSVKKLIFWCILAWGILASLTGVVRNLSMLLAVRLLLGVAEAAVMPAMLVYLSQWFTRSERSRANTFLILGNPITIVWMSVVSGYLVSLLNWRAMFIIEGLPAIVWAVIWAFTVNDRPAHAKWMDPVDREWLETSLEHEQKTIKPIRNYRAAFASPKVIWLSVQYFCWSMGIYGFVLWLPSILKKASSYSMVGTGWLSALPFLLAAPGMLITSHFSDKTLNRKLFVWPYLLIAGLAFFGSFALGSTNFWLSYSLLIIAAIGMYAPYGPFFAIVPEILPRNVAGGATAMINSMGALGGFFGSYFVGYLNTRTGGPSASFMLMSASLLVAGFITLILPAPGSGRDPGGTRDKV